MILYSPTGKFVNIFGGSADADGSFSTIPRAVDLYFKDSGTYNATGFLTLISDGVSILLTYDGNKVSIVPSFSLQLKNIGTKTVIEGENLSFTASVTDSSLNGLQYSLTQGAPTGATINSQSGVFSWTPTNAQGPASYLIDVKVSKGAIEKSQTFTVNVIEQSIAPPPPEPTENIPDFVDPKKGAQYYLDRYNNEAAYKNWFDSNFPDYTIQEAIEFAIPGSFSEPEPKPVSGVPDFIDPYAAVAIRHPPPCLSAAQIPLTK